MPLIISTLNTQLDRIQAPRLSAGVVHCDIAPAHALVTLHVLSRAAVGVPALWAASMDELLLAIGRLRRHPRRTGRGGVGVVAAGRGATNRAGDGRAAVGGAAAGEGAGGGAVGGDGGSSVGGGEGLGNDDGEGRHCEVWFVGFWFWST